MNVFELKIITPDRIFYDNTAENIILRTTVGEKGVLANHAPYVAALGIGQMRVFKDGKVREAAVSGGILKVGKNIVKILAETCEWKDEIDISRAESAQKSAEERLKSQLSAQEHEVAELKLKRALNRLSTAGR